MSTPYSTPSFPAPPRPTPASATSNRLPKAPIYNPYDKFTQNEFDSWIGGITCALRRALGQEGDEEELESVTQEQVSDLFAPRDNGDGEAELSPEYEPEESSEAEDSFAEIKTRVDKGKGRDPREGPGLGGRFQPIEILYSDSEEEDGEGKEEIEDDEVEEESEYGWRQYDSDGNIYDEYEGSGEENEEEGSGQRVNHGSPEDIIELSSGEEEEEEDHGSFEEDHAYQDVGEDEDIGSPDASDGYTLDITQFGQPLPPRAGDEDILGEQQEEHLQEVEQVTYATRIPLLPPQDGDEHLLGEEQGEHFQEEEEQSPYAAQPLPPRDWDEDMVREEQEEHPQEKEEQGLYTTQQHLPSQDGGEDILGEEQEEHPQEEEERDLYATQQPLPPQGGDENIPGEEREGYPQEEEEQGLYASQQSLPPQDGDEGALGEEEERPQEEEEEQDFPPRRSPSQPPDLADPWIGPQTYAEDFYSGGDIREGVLDPELVSPSNLTPVRARSEHTWEEDANGLLPPNLLAARKDPIIIDVDTGEDEKDENLLPRSSPLVSSVVEEYDSREGAYDENYEFKDDKASDELLAEETEGERPRELAGFATASPSVYVAAQPQTSPVDRTPISIPVAQDKLSPSMQDLGGHITSGPAHAVTPYINGTPEIIDLVDDDDDDDDKRDEIYDDNDDYPPEVEELSLEDGDEEPLVGSGTTSDLIWGGISEAEDITTQGAPMKLTGNNDDSAIEDPVVAELYQVNNSSSPKEAAVAAENEDAQISADQEESVHNVANDPEVISIVDSEESVSEEVHEVPADVRFKASLLETFLANADTMEQPTWNDNLPDVVTHFAQPPLSPVAEVAAVDHELGSSVAPAANKDLSDDYADVGDDPEPHIERLSGDEATYNDHDDLTLEGLDDMRESNHASQLIMTEALSQGVHYTVSEVVDDDGQLSTMSPDRNTDVASVVGDYTGGFIPYVVEEPISEGRMTQDPAERGETGGVEDNFPLRSNEDELPILSPAQNPPDVASTEILQSTLISGNDIHSHHQTSSPQGMPETASVEHNLANEPMLFDDVAVPAWEPLEEVRTFGAGVESVLAPDPLESAKVVVPAQEPPKEGGDGNAYAFPMPISDDPSVPDPASILRMPETHTTSDPSSTHPEASHYSALASTENPNETSLTVPPYALATPVEEEEEDFNASANSLFTLQNEVATAPPGSPDSQPIEPDGVKDEVTLGEPKRSATPISEALSIPIETTDVSNGEAPASINLDIALPHPVQPPKPAKSLDAVEDELDPFKLMGNDSKVAPGAIDDQHASEAQDERMDERMDNFQWPSQEIQDEETLLNNESINGAGTQVDEEQEATVTAASFYRNGTSLPSNDPRRSYNIDSAGDRQTKVSKRKRTLPPSIPARLTRSMSSKTAPIVDYKGKSKAKADIDTASENGSSSSSASIASRMLRASSRDTSRASSVVSTPQSVESSTFLVQQSPTLARQASNMSRQNQSKPFFHVHSGLHHHHRPSAVSRPSQIQRHSVAPSSQSNDTPTQSSGSQPSPSQRTAPAAHSPVTRSNCRFHRISLPREEGGPRVSFVVPGCSLGDRALMDEEDIQDEGDATTLDHARMVDDIETLDFSSDLVGILRQLVGVDLLRENEIFFLPHPGESYRRKRHGKSKLYAARSSSNDFAASLGLQSTATPRRGPVASKISSSPSLVHALTSAAGSASISAGSSHWNGRETDQYSPSTAFYSDDETVDPDENHGSQTKRRKGPSANRNGVASSEEMPPPSSGGQSKGASDKRGPRARRSKRLSLDAHAYKPEPETEEGSTDHDSEATEGPRKKTWKRGIKRNRTNEVVGPDQGQEPPTTKRLRVRLSTPSNSRR